MMPQRYRRTDKPVLHTAAARHEGSVSCPLEYWIRANLLVMRAGAADGVDRPPIGLAVTVGVV